VIPRRAFISLVGGAAAAWPAAAWGQQATPPVIGYLATGLRDKLQPELKSFHLGLNEVGYVEGQNVAIEYRWSEGQYDRLIGMATDLVSRQVDVIAVTGVPAALAAKTATSTIPIVFVIGPDPIKFGLVASLNRPGGNLTGATFFTSTLAPKRLELLRELLPRSSVIAFLVNSKNPRAELDLHDMEAAARTLHWSLVVLKASTDQDLDDAFAHLASRGVEALIVGADPFFHGRIERLIALSRRYGLPTIYSRREYVVAGGLIGYGTRLSDTYRQGGLYAGRILKGEKPADLPVLQPTTFELVINLKTAKVLVVSASGAPDTVPDHEGRRQLAPANDKWRIAPWCRVSDGSRSLTAPLRPRASAYMPREVQLSMAGQCSAGPVDTF
jgi:putative ABC transport system substrate-binding protein